MPVIDTDNGQMDVLSRLLKDRILLLGQGVDDEVANVLVAQLLYLANEDPDKDITLYINSPGGSVSAGMAIYDTMQYVPCDVSTVCFGMAASMGAFLLGAGAKGKRRALPNSRIMIHQPLGGAQGQAADIEIQAKEILFIREVLNTYIAEYCDQPKDKIEADCDRDFFMTPVRLHLRLRCSSPAKIFSRSSRKSSFAWFAGFVSIRWDTSLTLFIACCLSRRKRWSMVLLMKVCIGLRSDEALVLFFV